MRRGVGKNHALPVPVIASNHTYPKNVAIWFRIPHDDRLFDPNCTNTSRGKKQASVVSKAMVVTLTRQGFEVPGELLLVEDYHGGGESPRRYCS